jgi:hypothetical protein
LCDGREGNRRLRYASVKANQVRMSRNFWLIGEVVEEGRRKILATASVEII